MILSVIFTALVPLGLYHLPSRRFSLLAVRLFRSGGASLTWSSVDTRRTFLRSKAHVYSAEQSALRGITFSLPAGAGLSFSRLVIVSRTKVKDGRGSLYITHATGAITPRPSVYARIRRAAVRAASILTLFCRCVMVFSIAAALTTSYSSTFSSGSRALMISSNGAAEQQASVTARLSGELGLQQPA
jgi:hypothetical protein